MFSSPPGAHLISILHWTLLKLMGCWKFSSPPRAYLISIELLLSEQKTCFVFVPSRGISNLNHVRQCSSGGEVPVFVPSRGISNLNSATGDYGASSATFSSPPGAYLISIKANTAAVLQAYGFSSPTGAYLISIITSDDGIKTALDVFVPYRGISNLNSTVNGDLGLGELFSSPTGAYLISMSL